MKVFVSHSSRDRDLAEAVIALLRDALPLSSKDIRCTSVDGYRLPAGANTHEQLRREVSNAEAFIGIISQASLQSAYVIFELGARWGRGKHLAPLLAPGLGPSALTGPLQGVNALRADSGSQLHQLVTEVGDELQLRTEAPASYQKRVDQILSLSIEEKGSARANMVVPVRAILEGSRGLAAEAAGTPDSPEAVQEIIRNAAAEEHPGDFSTQRYVINEQLKDWNALREFTDPALPPETLEAIMRQAASEHPRDFSTQLYVVKEQVADWKSINRR